MAKGFAGIIEMAFDEQISIHKTTLSSKTKYKFDRLLFAEYLETGNKYIYLGYQTLDSWLAQMITAFGIDAEPWLRAVWSILISYKTEEIFEAKKLAAVMGAVGAHYVNGTTSLDDIKSEFKKLLKSNYEQVLPMIEASFSGVKTLFNLKSDE